MDRSFGGIFWTNHAMDRMRERGIKQGDAWATWNRPDQSYKGNLHKGEDAWRYYRIFGSERIEVVAKKDERGRWVVLSVWSRPVAANEVVNNKKTGKVSFWRFLYNLFFSS